MLEFGQDRGGAPTAAPRAVGSLQGQPWGHILILGTPASASTVPLWWVHMGAGDRNQQQSSSWYLVQEATPQLQTNRVRGL